jgi:hypothetical protein
MNDSDVPVVRPTEVSSGGLAETYNLFKPGAIPEMLAVLAENMGSAGVNALELARVKVPSGGGTVWMVPTLDGEVPTREIEGVIVSWRQARIYWKTSMDEGGGGRPPDCTSKDGFVGIGDPGGRCDACPYAQFGSASKGHGQACKQVRQLLLVMPDETLPHLITVPPTSLRALSNYMLALAGRQVQYWGITTHITLEKTQNEDKIAYSKMVFRPGRRLTVTELAVLAPYHRRMQEVLTPMLIEAADYQASEDESFASTPYSAQPGPQDPEVPF